MRVEIRNVLLGPKKLLATFVIAIRRYMMKRESAKGIKQTIMPRIISVQITIGFFWLRSMIEPTKKLQSIRINGPIIYNPATAAGEFVKFQINTLRAMR